MTQFSLIILLRGQSPALKISQLRSYTNQHVQCNNKNSQGWFCQGRFPKEVTPDKKKVLKSLEEGISKALLDSHRVVSQETDMQADSSTLVGWPREQK